MGERCQIIRGDQLSREINGERVNYWRSGQKRKAHRKSKLLEEHSLLITNGVTARYGRDQRFSMNRKRTIYWSRKDLFSLFVYIIRPFISFANFALSENHPRLKQNKSVFSKIPFCDLKQFSRLAGGE